MAISTEFATELRAVLARLRAARDNDPKHGAVAGAPDCGDDCDICFTEHHFNYLIDQIPRGSIDTAVDGVLEGAALAVEFIAPWPIRREGE